jgi:hypothetical protein
MNRDDYCEVDGGIYKTHTKDAILVAHHGEEIWIPRSVLSYHCDQMIQDRTYRRGEEIQLTLRYWFAEQKGMI